MKPPSILGVWRLESLTSGDRKVMTGETHLVVREDRLWEVWPRSRYYEGELGPEREYELSWEREDGRLEVRHPGRPSQCAIVRVFGDELQMRRSSMAGRFPESFYDRDGTFAVYARERGREEQRLLEPPARARRAAREHTVLGRLVYDDNVGWWKTKVRFGGAEGVELHVAGPPTMGDDVLDRAAEKLHATDAGALRAYAAEKLLELKNGSWLSDDEEPVDAETFASRLTPQSFGVDEEGGVSVFFDDGDLFWGHVVIVSLNERLEPTDAEIAG